LRLLLSALGNSQGLCNFVPIERDVIASALRAAVWG
jgi:hypothetical protein